VTRKSQWLFAGALFLAFTAGIAVDHFWLRTVWPRWVRHAPDPRDATTILKEDISKKWEGGLGNFGIRPGDVLLSVNGIEDQKMFQELVDGYNRGKVCALYQRDETTREVCLQTKTK